MRLNLNENIMLQKIQNYINWILPPVLGGSLYCIIYIAGHFEPEIFSWNVIIFGAVEIAFLFFLVRRFLNYRFQKEGVRILNFKNFLMTFAIVQIFHLGIYVCFKYLLIIIAPQDDSISWVHLLLTGSLGIVYGIILVGTQLMLLFFKGWNESKIREEQLEKENTKAKLASLKLQLNPHFLFNNFHTLDGLIHEDQKEASSFLMELSGLYRSILRYSDDEIILLEKELELVKHFNFLMEKRFSENFYCEILLSTEVKDNFFVPPMSIQLLLENVVKHNRIDKENPLKCSISKEGDYVVVKNKLAPKRQVQKSSGIGLENLKLRYELLSDLPVVIEDGGGEFIVKIPLLDVAIGV